MTTTTTKVKVYGDDAQAILKIIDEIRNLFAPNVTQSDLLESRPNGYHAFLTIYLEDRR